MSFISINNQEFKVRPEIINVNSDELVFNLFSIKTSKCGGICNNINDPYAKTCVPDVIKNLNVKVFNPISRTNQTRDIKWHETCNCKCRLDVSVSNNKQRWNDDKCRCKCKELIDNGVLDKGYIWKPSDCEYECDKSCDVDEYLDHKICKFRKKLADKLEEECNEIVEEVKIVGNNEDKCSSCILYVVLFSITFIINIGIGVYFVYYKYINHDKENVSKYDYVYQSKNYSYI